MRRQIFTVLVLVAVSLLLNSCFSQSYKVGPRELTQEKILNQQKSHFLFWGLVHLNRVHLDALTLDSVNYQVEVVHTFADALVSTATLGLYTPSTIRVEVSAVTPKPKRKRILLLKFPDEEEDKK
jgi:hypothetical protein